MQAHLMVFLILGGLSMLVYALWSEDTFGIGWVVPFLASVVWLCTGHWMGAVWLIGLGIAAWWNNREVAQPIVSDIQHAEKTDNGYTASTDIPNSKVKDPDALIVKMFKQFNWKIIDSDPILGITAHVVSVNWMWEGEQVTVKAYRSAIVTTFTVTSVSNSLTNQGDVNVNNVHKCLTTIRELTSA